MSRESNRFTMSMDNSGRNLRRIHHCDVHGLQWKEFEKNIPLWIGAGGKVVMCQDLLQLVVFVHYEMVFF